MRQSSLAVAVSLWSIVALWPGAVAGEETEKRKPDLGDAAAGSYYGDIISDARGSSQSDIGVTVVRTGPNEVEVTCDCPRIPSRTFKLTRAMDTIQNVGGTEVFLLDIGRTPRHLDLTIDDASWSGEPVSP
jgi:hypothetical protein